MSKPNIKKVSAVGENPRLRFGFSAMQGWRMTMEDAHISDPNFTSEMSLFAIFDGHGGDDVAKFCERHLGDQLKKSPAFQRGDFKAALEDTFLKMDSLLVSSGSTDGNGKQEYEDVSAAGCTANVVLVTANEILVANAGDSRCYLYTDDGKTVPLSEDHKPDNITERDRISKAGGYVSNGRVCDNLNLSRAIGDLTYKKNSKMSPKDQIISAFPDVVTRKLAKDCRFLVIGCDGIWETIPPSEICKIVADRLSKNPNHSLSEISELLLDRLIAKDTQEGTGCDNMSLIIVQFKS